MSTSVSRSAQKQATRAAIIEAAAWLFARRGIDATSIDAVAARVGLTKGAVYANFESKRELIEAVAEAYSAPADFTYGRPEKGHGWHSYTWAEMIRKMARQVAQTAPRPSAAESHRDRSPVGG